MGSLESGRSIALPLAGGLNHATARVFATQKRPVRAGAHAVAARNSWMLPSLGCVNWAPSAAVHTAGGLARTCRALRGSVR